MCRTSRNFGISLCSSWVLLLGVLASVTCSAQQQYEWQASENFPPYTVLQGGDPKAVGQQFAQDHDSLTGQQCAGQLVCPQNPVVTCTSNAAPTAAGQGDGCTWSDTFEPGPNYSSGCPGPSACSTVGNAGPGGFASLVSISPANSCQASTTPKYFSGGGNGAPPPSQCSGGCNYEFNGVGVQAPGIGWGGSYTETGGSCNVSNTGSAGSNCVTGPNGTYCAQDAGSGAGQCGTVNGDQVCPGAVPPGGCVSYQSGGMACASGAAGAPNNGTPGQPATPTTTVTGTNSDGSASTVNYYSSTVVAGSSGGTASSSGGQNVGNGGAGPGQCGSAANPCNVVGGGGGSGGGSTPSAANGDCGASGVDCSLGGNPLPSYDWSSDSWSGATTSFWNAVAAGPVGSAVGGISSAWPSGGSCPAMTVSLGTLNMTADYGTTFCDMWESSAAPVLTIVMLAVWSMIAVFIFLSA